MCYKEHVDINMCDLFILYESNILGGKMIVIMIKNVLYKKIILLVVSKAQIGYFGGGVMISVLNI